MEGITSVTIINSTGQTGGRHQQRGQEGKTYERTNCDAWKTQRPPGSKCCRGGEKVERAWIRDQELRSFGIRALNQQMLRIKALHP